MSADWEDLDRKLREGDGLNFSGDPDLWLGVGVVKTKQGRVLGHRLEVWRDCEDGTTQLLGTWHPSELFRVCYDLAQMRGALTGRAETAEVRIDRANEAKQREKSDQFMDAMAPVVEELAYDLVRKQGHAKTTFSVPGRRDG